MSPRLTHDGVRWQHNKTDGLSLTSEQHVISKIRLFKTLRQFYSFSRHFQGLNCVFQIPDFFQISRLAYGPCHMNNSQRNCILG